RGLIWRSPAPTERRPGSTSPSSPTWISAPCTSGLRRTTARTCCPRQGLRQSATFPVLPRLSAPVKPQDPRGYTESVPHPLRQAGADHVSSMFTGLSAFPLTPLSDDAVDVEPFIGLIQRLA